jgi:predicted N-acetyltransferase YhbS
MEVNLRSGTPRDAEACGSICYDAFKTISDKHGFPADFPAPEATIGLMSWVLARGDVYSVVAESDGQIVGSNFLWETGTIAGVGPLSVTPSAQDGGLGRRLMEHVLARAREQRFAGVRLTQGTYHNRSLSLYARLGFAARELLSCLQGPPPSAQIPGYAVRPAKEPDLEACNRVCRAVHGHERSREVKEAIHQGTATVVEHDGRITGYATVVGYFGHAAGESNEDLKALIGAASTIAGPGMLVPTRNSELLRWCLQRGLRITQPLTLMSLGLYNEPSGAFLPSVIP